jgi:hypothetical protein
MISGITTAAAIFATAAIGAAAGAGLLAVAALAPCGRWNPRPSGHGCDHLGKGSSASPRRPASSITRANSVRDFTWSFLKTLRRW